MKKIIISWMIVSLLLISIAFADIGSSNPPIVCNNNGIQDDGETGIDCGGPNCPGCLGDVCSDNADCRSNFCFGGNPLLPIFGTKTCHAPLPSCNDGIQNQGETGIDCGGGLCGPCTICNNGLFDPPETDIDCGGSSAGGQCSGCDNGKVCRFDSDCLSGLCGGFNLGIPGEPPKRCIPTSLGGGCFDGITNHDETDVDCGGSSCVKCGNGNTCSIDSDCSSDHCENNICSDFVETCSDGIRNQDETQIDCGGVCGACPTINVGINGFELDCNIKQQCETGEVDLLHLSSLTNAHAEIPTLNNYDNKLCCGGVPGLDTTCTQDATIVARLQTETNSHVGFRNNVDYGLPICLNAEEEIVCTIAETQPTPNADCLFSIHSERNSHIAQCDEYQHNVYCSVVHDPSLIPGWSEAFGLDYAGYGINAAEHVETFNDKENVIVITDNDDTRPFAVVSDKYNVDDDVFLTASIDVHCEDGLAVLELEMWDKDNNKIGALQRESKTINNWERLFVSGRFSGTAYVTILLSTGFQETGTCAFDNAKLEIAQEILDKNSDAPEFTNTPSIEGGFACCPGTSCWDGTQCVSDTAGNARLETDSDFRCVDGDWVFSPIVFTWDKTQRGICSTSTQCLVDLDGNVSLDNQPESYFNAIPGRPLLGPQCIESGQFILDNYCSNTTWETRTKQIAVEMLQLLEINGVPDDYTLYCDSFDQALVETSDIELERILGQTNPIGARTCFGQGERSEPCVNNFCLLEYVERGVIDTPKRIVGVSLNKDVNDPVHSFLKVVKHSENDCDNVVSGGDFAFKECNDDTLYFSPELNAVLFSNEGIDFNEPGFLEGLVSFLKWSLRYIAQEIGDIISGTDSGSQTVEQNFDFIDETTRFERVYFSVKGDKNIYAVQENVNQSNFIVAQYKGFSRDICSYVQNKVAARGITPEISAIPVLCNVTGDTHFVFTQDSDAVSLWQDFTSKLRVQG